MKLFAANIHVKVFVIDGFVDAVGRDVFQRCVDFRLQRVFTLAHGDADTAAVFCAAQRHGRTDTGVALAFRRLQKCSRCSQRRAKADIATAGSQLHRDFRFLGNLKHFAVLEVAST